jgi:hypothetical protein
MNPTRRALAAVQLLLMCPAILFMGALVVRQLSPLQQEPAYTAQRIVMWHAARLWTLWVLLITLPFAVLVMGSVTFLRSRSQDHELPQGVQQVPAAIRADRATYFIAVMTLTAGVVLTIVALHMLAN